MRGNSFFDANKLRVISTSQTRANRGQEIWSEISGAKDCFVTSANERGFRVTAAA
jgi:hypothetical protein